MKDKLRTKMREKRRALTADEVKEKSTKIRENLFSLDAFKSANTVCTFISAFKEPDTTEIIMRLWSEGKKVIVPITDPKTNTLMLSYLKSFFDVKKSTFNVPEPVVIYSANESDIDAVLVPGLAFDKSGGRMGFGKGYYDRLLENSTATKIALCYEFQLFDKIPTEAHDVPMDIIVTEEKIYVV